jgi:hypothetical protein
MRQCLESELDGEFLLVADPSQCKFTTWSVKVVVTFEQKLHPKIFVPTSSFRYNNELNFGIFSKVTLAKSPGKGMSNFNFHIQGVPQFLPPPCFPMCQNGEKKQSPELATL